MSDPIAFLRARLDEDEATARAATPGPWRYNPAKEWRDPDDRRHREERVFAGQAGSAAITVCLTGPSDDEPSMSDAAHIARWDPARVLAEVAVKRALLDRVGDFTYHEPRCPYTSCDCEVWTAWALAMILVQPYADHPDFDPAWSETRWA